MKKKLIFALAILPFLSSCSSSDEPEKEYTGPWAIIYEERYFKIHNESDAFKDWFTSHQDVFLSASLFDDWGKWEFTYKEDYPVWDDYTTYYRGHITWQEIFEKASKEQLETLVAEFEAFTIPKTENGEYDTFTATIHP